MDEIAEAVTHDRALGDAAGAEDPRLLGLMRELIASNDPQRLCGVLGGDRGGDDGRDRAVACPVLAFCGSERPVTPPRSRRRRSPVAAPDGRTGVDRGRGALVPARGPAATIAVLFGFLVALARRPISTVKRFPV